MTQAALKEKVLNIEAELKKIKEALKQEPDFAVDEKTWKAVKPTAKKVGRKLYVEQYGKA